MPKVQALSIEKNQQFLDSINSLELPDVHDTPLVDPVTDTSKPIHNDVEIEQKAVSNAFVSGDKEIQDQVRSSPNMTKESPQQKSFPERKLESFNLENEIVDIFKLPEKEDVISKNVKMNESVEIALKDYCHAIRKLTGRKPKEKDVVGNAIIEYIKNHPAN